ncbi:hypothetical protein [Parapedobacter sp. 10938]|uniref:hypothetical protein n=1 Tax=Parapedobacter flavus TaxID=3110225 RepID=UPI002DB78BC6|nr:hypothetical protein [Parapedobacter sp. 10938]MEC3878620.1 hypothetical protein [Parapedobacter sp. 10938]
MPHPRTAMRFPRQGFHFLLHRRQLPARGVGIHHHRYGITNPGFGFPDGNAAPTIEYGPALYKASASMAVEKPSTAMGKPSTTADEPSITVCSVSPAGACHRQSLMAN